MLFQPRHEDRLDRLAEQLRLAPAISAELMRDFVAEICERLAAVRVAGKSRIDRLMEQGAWTEAALALVEAELPRWRVRRMVCEGGEWLCSLSSQPQVPIEYDDLAEGRHASLPLAILNAMLEARRCAASANRVGSQTVPQVRPIPSHAVCCDNFA
jgi:hypothetical protein